MPETATTIEPSVCEDIFAMPMNVMLPASLMEFTKRPPRTVQVQFDTNAETKNLVIGSIGPHENNSFSEGKVSNPGTFEIAFESGTANDLTLMEKYRKYFTLGPLKGTVSPGNETNVRISFNPKADQSRETTNAGELRILHWIRVTAKVTLRGGYMPPGISSPDQVVQLVLKARVLT